MNKKLVGLAVAAALSVTAFNASADDMYRGAWYAVPGITYMHPDNDLDADNGVHGGFISIGKELSPSWDIQGRLGYNRPGVDTSFPGASGHYKQTTLGLDALYLFSRDKFRPFLLAGLGVARNDLDYSAPGVTFTDTKKTSWMANAGLGAQYLISDKFGLQADLRYQWSRAKYTVSGPGGTISDNGTVGNTLFNLGGIFRFGEAAPVVAEAAPEPAPLPVAEPAPAPAPAPAPKCDPVVETITIDATELFGFNKAKITNHAKLDEVVSKMKENPIFANVKVVGHTDKIGSAEYNQKLSEKRANAVREYIIAQGVEPERLVAVGMGEDHPVVTCDGVKGRKKLIECLAPNRRVEIEATHTKEEGCQ